MPTHDSHLAGPDRNILVFRLPERLNHVTAESVTESVCRGVPNRDDAGVVLDCTDVELITSIGIASLLQIAEHCHDVRAPLVLASLSESLRSMLDIVKLLAKFKIADDVDEGVAMVERAL
ncbi:MAG: STAS domain-containing protein [Phycisphaerales bacterium]